MVQLKVNLNSDIITIQNPLEIGIVNMILSFQNIYGNWKILENIYLKMEYSCICLPLSMWYKTLWFEHNRKVHNCEGRSRTSSEEAYRIYFQMPPSKQIPLEKRQIMIFKVVSYFNRLIAMLINTVDNSMKKCNGNLNFAGII